LARSHHLRQSVTAQSARRIFPVDIRPVSCEVINPRKDLPYVAAQLYRAMQSKPCACGKRRLQDGTIAPVECGGCAAMRRYEAVTEALR
jgi:hypothetical protein